MVIPHYIVKNHNGVYYFRCRVAVRHRYLFPYWKEEIRKSLRTRDVKKALSKARILWLFMTNYLDDLDKMDEEIGDYERGLRLLKKLDDLNEAADKSFDSTELDNFLFSLSVKDQKLISELSSQRTAHSKVNKSLVNNSVDYNVIKLIDQYLNEKSDIRERSLKSYKAYLYDFVEIAEVTNLSDITPASVRHYKQLFMKLPPNRKKIPEYEGLTAVEIVNKGVAKSVTRETCRTVFRTVSSFLKWLHDSQYINHDLTGVFKLSKNAKKSSEHRAVFTEDDLSKIFGVDEYQTIGGFRKYPFRYWVPLIGLYAGIRLNEICQLHLSDVKKIKDIWVFNVNDEGEKLLKTQSAIRVVPIHSRLIELGFIKYVTGLKNETLLFGGLSKDGDGKYYRKVSRFFNDDFKGKRGLLEYAGIERVTDKGDKNFHSFRHTFINQAKQQLNVNYAIIKEVVGHSQGDITFDRYGKSYEISTKKKEINKITFNFTHPRKWA